MSECADLIFSASFGTAGREVENHVLSLLQRQADPLQYRGWTAVRGTDPVKVMKTPQRLETGVPEECNSVKKKLLHECFIVAVDKLHDAEKPKNKNYLLRIPHLEKKITVHILVQFLPRSSSPLHMHTHARAHTHRFLFIALDYTMHALWKPPFSLKIHRAFV